MRAPPLAASLHPSRRLPLLGRPDGGGKWVRGRARRKTRAKYIKKKTAPLAASAREVERASSGFPARPAGRTRVSPRPDPVPLPAAPRPSLRPAFCPPPHSPPALPRGGPRGVCGSEAAGPAHSLPQRGRGARRTWSPRLGLWPGPAPRARDRGLLGHLWSSSPRGCNSKPARARPVRTRKPAASASVRHAGAEGQPATWSFCAHWPGRNVSRPAFCEIWKLRRSFPRRGLVGCRGGLLMSLLP